jgi:tetratricopeptide (TPR) repeat protein
VIAAYRAVLNIEPDNQVALNNLAVALLEQRRYAEAESLANRATLLGRGSSFFLNTIQAQLAQGKLVEAQETASRYSKSAPGSPFAEAIQAQMSRVRRELPEAERRFQAIQDRHRESPFIRMITARSLSSVAQTQGRIQDAKRHLEGLMFELEKDGSKAQYLVTAAALAKLEVRYRQDLTRAITVLRGALKQIPLSSLDPFDRPYDALAGSYAMAGSLDEARRLLREYDSVVPEAVRRTRLTEIQGRAALAEASGHDEAALDIYRAWMASDGNCPSCGAYEIGRIHDRRGEVDSAIGAFERVVATPTLDDLRLHEGYTLAPSLKRLGELYEARGDRSKAAEYYGRFADLWKEADPEFQPVVKEIRGRLAALTREPGD